MEKVIIQFLQSLATKRFRTKDLLEYLQNKLGSNFWESGGYIAIVQEINQLVKQEVLYPVKAWKENGMNPSLYNGYRFQGWSQVVDSRTKQRLLTYYHPHLNVSSYIQDIDLYQQDRVYLEQLDSFLKRDEGQKEQVTPTVNERSFQIFRDEKWLASSVGQGFLQRVGLSLADLNCNRTYEPFFYYQHTSNKQPFHCLIVENKDTFFSLKSLMQAGVTIWANCDISMLIYGEGNKIIHSFSYFFEIYQDTLDTVEVWYFGDLDSAGIRIWYELAKNEIIEIRPFQLFYTGLVQQNYDKAGKLRTSQGWSQPAIDLFLSYFGQGDRDRMLDILNNDRYLPQEALAGQELYELATKKEHSHAMD